MTQHYFKIIFKFHLLRVFDYHFCVCIMRCFPVMVGAVGGTTRPTSIDAVGALAASVEASQHASRRHNASRGVSEEAPS